MEERNQTGKTQYGQEMKESGRARETDIGQEKLASTNQKASFVSNTPNTPNSSKDEFIASNTT